MAGRQLSEPGQRGRGINSREAGEEMITREYPTVVGGSTVPVSLMDAHATRVTQEEARKIIFTYLDEDEVNYIRFTCKTARAWCSYRGRSVVLKFHPNEYLTLGLVLHEIAHALCWIDKKQKGHGEVFIETLDGLVKSEAEDQSIQ